MKPIKFSLSWTYTLVMILGLPLIISCGDLTLQFSDHSSSSTLPPEGKALVVTRDIFKSRLKRVFAGDPATASAVDSVIQTVVDPNFFAGPCNLYSTGSTDCASNLRNTLAPTIGFSSSGRLSNAAKACYMLTSRNTGNPLQLVLKAVDNSIMQLPSYAQLRAVQAILTNASHGCMSCHRSSNYPWAGALSNGDWIASNNASGQAMIQPGQPAPSSYLYQRLTSTTNRMPPAGYTPLNATELQTVRTWIEGMNAAAVNMEEELARAFELFYPAQEPPMEIINALKQVRSDEMSLTHDYGSAWQKAFLTLCLSSGWQLM